MAELRRTVREGQRVLAENTRRAEEIRARLAEIREKQSEIQEQKETTPSTDELGNELYDLLTKRYKTPWWNLKKRIQLSGEISRVRSNIRIRDDLKK